MSSVWLKLITVLCLLCTALNGSESSEVVWKDVGAAITIQCRPPESAPNQEYMNLMKGINEDVDIVYKDGKSEKTMIAKNFTNRLQLHGEFPNVDILIKNLTSDDTGPYWCGYKKFDLKSNGLIRTKGTGSVLLVVTAVTEDTVQQCEPTNENLVLVPVVITAAVLLTVIMGCLIWIILKTKTLCATTAKPRHVATNDVYEDMRGTLRR